MSQDSSKSLPRVLNFKTEQIIDFRKLGEGGFNRVFLVTLDTHTQLVARIPYPLVTSKAYTIASEVATMDFLRLKGLPIPKIYGYSFKADNEAQTEYILMEYVKGTSLSTTWTNLKNDEIISLMKQVVKLESTMMSIHFPAGGSIYYARDLEVLSGTDGIRIDEHDSAEAGFCIGPDVSIPLWYGRRQQLNVFRGPYEDTRSVLVAGAQKELAYLERFGSPRLPYQRIRREYYNYKKQSPSDHVKNLYNYLRLAPSLVPADDSLSTFCIRHPDLSDSNIKIMRGSEGIQILGVLDWQYAAVLPLFLQVGEPEFIQNDENDVSQMVVEPGLPDDFDSLPEEDQEWQKELYRRHLVHFHYLIWTATFNRTHREGLAYPLNSLLRRVYVHASAVWEGETINLLHALIESVLKWESFAPDGTPCPVSFTEEEMEAAKKLYDDLRDVEKSEGTLTAIIGCTPPDNWVPAAHYDEAKILSQEFKRIALKVCKKDDYDLINANWPLDDMDEGELEEYK